MNYPSRQPIENKLISVEFWRKLQAIPGVMVNVGNPDRAHPILCKSDVGVECLVMPICADYHNQVGRSTNGVLDSGEGSQVA
jgi:hypothetical protein